MRAGFQRTEAGIIPQDWDSPSLGDILKSTQLGGNYKNSERETRWPLIKMGNLDRGTIKLNKVEFIEPGTPPRPRDRLRQGDLLFNTRNTLDLVGKIAVWRSELSEAYYNSNIMKMAFNQDRVATTYFMNYILNTPSFLKLLRSIAIGTTSVAAIYRRDLDLLCVPLPPKAEQEAIAGALRDVDALIEATERLIAKKRQIKQGVARELLSGMRRLPGFDGNWHSGKLADFGVFLKGRSISRSESGSGDIPAVRYGEIYTKHHEIIEKFYSHISRFVSSSATRLNAGDILFAGSGETKEEIGKCAALVDNIEAYAGGDIVIFRPYESDPAFLGYYLNIPQIGREKASRGQGDAVVHISAAALADIPVKIPDLSEQRAISEMLVDCDKYIGILEEKLSKARDLKKGMMQELLTGRIRLI